MEYVLAWMQALCLTCGAELLAAVPMLPPSERPVRRMGAVLIAQCCTHPVVWFVLPKLVDSPWTFLWVAQTWAVLAETAVYHLAFPEMSWRRCLRVSGVANALSAALAWALL